MHAIGFHPKEAQRAAWVIDGVLAAAGGGKRRGVSRLVGGGRGGEGKGGAGKELKESPRVLTVLVEGNFEGGGEVDNVSAVKEWGEDAKKPETSPRLFSESLGSCISDFKDEEEPKKQSDGEEGTEEETEEGEGLRVVSANPIVNNCSDGTQMKPEKEEEEEEEEEPRLFVAEAVAGNLDDGKDNENVNTGGVPPGERSGGRRLLVAGAGKLNHQAASNVPSATELPQKEEREEQAMETLWGFANKTFEPDLQEVRVWCVVSGWVVSRAGRGGRVLIFLFALVI